MIVLIQVPVSVPIVMFSIVVAGSVPVGIRSITVAFLVPLLDALIVGTVVWVMVLLSSVLVIVPTVLLIIFLLRCALFRVLEAASDGDLYVKLGPDNMVVHIHPQIA